MARVTTDDTGGKNEPSLFRFAAAVEACALIDSGDTSIRKLVLSFE
jgi:hypothetical protein